MFLVSLLPTASAAAATPAQESNIKSELGLAPVFDLDWQDHNEVHELFLSSGDPGLTYATQDTTTETALLAGIAFPSGAPAPVRFNFAQTVADVSVLTFSADLYITTSTEATVFVNVFAQDTATGAVALDDVTNLFEDPLEYTIGGVLVNTPMSTSTIHIVLSGTVDNALVAAGKWVGITVTAETNGTADLIGAGPLNQVTLHYGSTENPSKATFIADSTRIAAWTAKPSALDDTVPDVLESNFPAALTASSVSRSIQFAYAQLNAFGELALAHSRAGFNVQGPDGTVFASSGSPADVSSARPWGASNQFPVDVVDDPGVDAKSYFLTYPGAIDPGTYRFVFSPCQGTGCDVAVNVGQVRTDFQLLDEEPNKEILIGQRTTYRLLITNNGDISDVFALQANVGASPSGWTASMRPAQVPLDPGQKIPVELTVTPPSTGTDGQSNTVTASATSLLTGQSFALMQGANSAILRVTLTNDRVFGLTIVNAADVGDDLLVLPARSSAVPVVIRNDGNGFDRFVASLTGAPAGWTASMSPGLVQLDAASEGVSVLKVEAPTNGQPPSFPLTLRVSRLDDASLFETLEIPVKVADVDAFTFHVYDGTLVSAPTTIGNRIERQIRDEGPDETTPFYDTNEDKDADNSTLFRLVLTNSGSRSDAYVLTPYVLTSGSSTAAALAGESPSSSTTVRTDLGFQDRTGCDQATDVADGINDGWYFRLVTPDMVGTPAGDFASTVQDFDTTKTAWDATVTVPAGTSKVVYAEMNWKAPTHPATSGCASTAQTGVGARSGDPAPGHAVLIEAVSQNDPSHRASQVLGTKVVPSTGRTAAMRYGNAVNDVALLNEGSDLNLVPIDRTFTTSFPLRAVSLGNEMDTLELSMPKYGCPTATSPAADCWVHSYTIDSKMIFPNNLGLGGTCTEPKTPNSAQRPAVQLLEFSCTMGSFDEIGVTVNTQAPEALVAIGDLDDIQVTVTSQDSVVRNSIQTETMTLTAKASGSYALDVLSIGTSTPALVHPGNTTVIPFTVHNLGTEDDNVIVDLRDTPATGWSVTFSVPNPIFVPAGRQVDLLAIVSAPGGDSAPAVDTVKDFVVRATSLDFAGPDPPSDVVTVQAKVLAKAAFPKLSAAPSQIFTPPGESAPTTLQVIKARASDTVTLSVDATSKPAGWTASLATTSPDFGTGTTATTTLSVTPPATALGTSRAAIRVIAINATGAKEYIHVGVGVATPNLGIDLASPEGLTLHVAPGAATPVRLTVENLGVSQDVIRLTAGTMPTGWAAVFDAENLTLQPLQKRSINVSVTSPADLAAGASRVVTFIGTTSDGLRSDSLQVNFTTGRSILGVLAKTNGTTLNQLPLEPFGFTLTVNNTGDLSDEVVMRAALAGAFHDVVQVTFTPAAFDLDPGQAQEVSVQVTFPAGLTPKVDVPVVIEAASKGPFLKSVGSATVATKVLDHKVRDVDGDLVNEYAVDRDLDASNGYEEFRDPSVGTGASKAVDAGSLLNAAAQARNTVVTTVNGNSTSVVRFRFDPDGDQKTDLLVDTDADGKPNVYWDPDRGYSHVIPVLKDVTKDGIADYFFDLDGEGGLRLDVYYDPIEGRTGRLLQIDIDNNGVLDYVVDTNGNSQPDATETVLFGGPEGTIASIRESADVDGDGKMDTVIDSNGDGNPDYFIPNGKTAGVAIVLEDVDGDGIDDWTYDSDGDGRRDAYYNPATGNSGFLDTKGDFFGQLKEYWYIGALFGVVLVLFVVLLLVTRK